MSNNNNNNKSVFDDSWDWAAIGGAALTIGLGALGVAGVVLAADAAAEAEAAMTPAERQERQLRRERAARFAAEEQQRVANRRADDERRRRYAAEDRARTVALAAAPSVPGVFGIDGLRAHLRSHTFDASRLGALKAWEAQLPSWASFSCQEVNDLLATFTMAENARKGFSVMRSRLNDGYRMYSYPRLCTYAR